MTFPIVRAPTVFFLVLTAIHSVGLADSPLPPPSKYIRQSPDANITAWADLDTDKIEFHRTNSGEILWRHPQWSGWFFVANDGQHFVTGFPGINLIYDYDEELVLFTFWRRNQKLRDVTLKDFVPDKGVLRKTASHYHWGSIEKIDPEGRLVVRRADDWVFLFELSSGRNLGGKHSPPVLVSQPTSARGKRFGSYSVTTVAFAEPGLSRVSFWGSYLKLEEAIEVKFDAKGNAAIDGEPIDAARLADELDIRRLLFGTQQLCVVGDEFPQPEPLLEKVARLRPLGFDDVTITTDYVWNYDPRTKRWSRRE